jgi:hypothetical protein
MSEEKLKKDLDKAIAKDIAKRAFERNTKNLKGSII